MGIPPVNPCLSNCNSQKKIDIATPAVKKNQAANCSNRVYIVCASETYYSPITVKTVSKTWNKINIEHIKFEHN